MRKYLVFLSFVSRHQILFYYGTALLITGVAVASRILFNGMIFDFDYHLYHPDGAAYTFMALKYAGYSHLEAGREILSWYEMHAKPGTEFDLTFFSKQENPIVWGLAESRVVYPMLSAPFVFLLGVKGMLVIPIISFFLLTLVIMDFGRKNQNLPIALAIVFLITASTSVSRWYVANLTDGVLATILALAALVIVRGQNTTKSLLIVAFLVILGSFTRFSLPYWFGLALFALLRRSQILALVVSVVSLISFIPTFLGRPGSESFVAGAPGDGMERLLYLPVSAIRVLFVELAQLAAMDRALLILLAIAVMVSLLRWRHDSAQLFAIMCLAGWSIGALNGVLGVNFRYQLPILVFAAYAILDLLRIALRLSGSAKKNL